MFAYTIIAQESYSYIQKTDTLKINLDNIYELSAFHIVPLSEKIILGKKKLSANDYSFDFSSTSFRLSDTLKYSIFDTLFISYKSYNLKLKKEYKHRSIVKRMDDLTKESVSIVKNESVDLSSKAIFGEQLKSNGTLLRGFSVGSNKDLTLNSGLRLQLSGNLSDDITIVAALTDENTPIQPEGNTERLEELDKVFIEIKHKIGSATFGDYNLNTSVGEFGKFNRKLQGVIGKIGTENYGGSVAVAGARGKFHSSQFAGIDGVQGPYRLRGADNENDIIVIAGSEKIFIDGKELKRGENNEYTIEYSTAEVTFTPKVLITSLSRIIIDFEYTSRKYERNIIGGNGYANLFDDKLKIKFNIFQEGDNKNNPIDFLLSEDDKTILNSSGNDHLSASQTGVSLVEADSNGNRNGVYSKIDTVLNNIPTAIYVYDPNADSSIYVVTFSFLGESKGDYIRESIGRFKFVGNNQGSYLPIRLLPLPENTQVGNIAIEYELIKKVKINLELAGSNFDRNTLSEFDDENNIGSARNFRIDIAPLELNLSNQSYGKISGYFRDRFLDDNFKSIDRINEIEFDRYYNTSNSISSDELLREMQLNYSPLNDINLKTQYGLLKKGSLFSSERYLTNIDWKNYKNIKLNYSFDNVDTKNKTFTTKWLRQNGEVTYDISSIVPGFLYRAENKQEFGSVSDSLLIASKKYYEYSPFVHFNISKGFNISAKYSFTEENIPIDGKYVRESQSFLHTYSLNFSELKELTSSTDFSFRKKKYSETFANKGFGDNETILIRNQTRLNLFKRLITGQFYYQAATERAARLERVFLRVPIGTGSHSYQGDLNENGIAEENEFIPDPFEGDFIQTTIPTDALFPVIDLKINTRWKIDFAKYFTNKSIVGNILSSLYSETAYKLEENSREEETSKIYLLNSNYFLNDSTTIRGSNYFQQDLHIFKNKRELSFRFRYTQRKSLNQFSAGLEKGYYRQQSLRIKFRMVKEINNETEIISRTENILAPINTNRSLTTNANIVISDFSYRPVNSMEFGFKIKVSRLEDTYPQKPTIIDENKITLRFTLSLFKKGRLRIEAERTELISNTKENIIPFEITNGNLIGKNYIWRSNFDYRFSNNLQINVNYSGRLQGAGRVINTMRAEARAYF
ncbi:MAG: hypothetical protein GY936_04530 [Ignavibacteriae bacterium]|nr:hypothetical protein [Ignavibacteriota bacterium]